MYNDANMSDTTLLVSVEDLINRAMGPPDVNIVNFKLIQLVLQILARQQRVLSQRVEIKATELAAAPPKLEMKKEKSVEEFTESSSSKSPRLPEKLRMEEIKEEHESDEKTAQQKIKDVQKKKEKAEKIKLKEKERAEKMLQKEQEKAEKKGQRDEDKAGKIALKEREKAEKTAQKEQEKAEKTAQKEQEKAEKTAQKDQEKAEKTTQKKQEKAEKTAQKEQEKAEKTAQKEQEKAVKTAQKEQEKVERAAQKDQEMAGKLAQKEQEKAEKAALKEVEKADKAQKGQEKTQKAALKEQEKAEKAALKEQEKADKAQRDQEKADKRDQAEKEKAERQALKEKERIEKMTEKEKEKYLKEAAKIQKEAERAEKEAEKEKKRSAEEQEKAEKEKARAEKEKESKQSRSKSPAEATKGKKKAADNGISITETIRGKESVIVVEKGPTTRSDSRSPTNIDIVTQSQFALLESAVRELKNVAVPKPLEMPDNKKLRSDLVKGTASLPDTMEAMQVGARVKAAEAAIDRMTGLLTQLAAAGALPEDLAEQVEIAAARAAGEQAKQTPMAPKKSVLIDPKLSRLDARPSITSRLEVQPSMPSQTTTPRPSILSRQSTLSMGPGVTHEEMDSALKDLREELSKNLQGVMARAATAADTALHTAMNVANKLEVALKLDVRISSLFTIVSDYAEQLSGFDAGLTTQMQSFKDQIGQMRMDLKNGLAMLENVNNNAETAAVLELTERYTELVGELDTTLSAHNALQRLQGQLGDEMHSLVECVEMLREQKCDKDEVLDGLRDKADISRLAGLLSETKFATARSDFERRLDLCHEKFRRQDVMWTSAIKDLTRMTDKKSELIELLSLRDHTQKQLQELHDRLRALSLALGEPKAALLTRLLSRGASCGACGTAALMEPQDASAGAPPRLPPLRAPPEPEPCTHWVTAEPPLDKHICHRWVGGSHTLLPVGGTIGHGSEASTPAGLDLHRTHKYTGYGDDGRLYMMEEELKPCIECNSMNTNECSQPDAVPGGEGGAGDARD